MGINARLCRSRLVDMSGYAASWQKGAKSTKTGLLSTAEELQQWKRKYSRSPGFRRMTVEEITENTVTERKIVKFYKYRL